MTETNPSAKALWFIESHFAEELTLDDIASAAGVSRYHLSRVFALAIGDSVMQYLRARRLTEAARKLANGAPDILALALEAGYGSHEAFTRAFRDQFGVTPEDLRAGGHLENIKLKEPIKMDESLLTHLDPPRVETLNTRFFVGLSERYNAETSANIPAQWQHFAPHIGHIPGQIGYRTYGVVYNGDESGNTEYLSGVEVPDFSRVPPELTTLRVPEQKYAVWTQKDHISTIRRTWFTIFNKALPDSGHKSTGGPELEIYPETFDPRTGNGGFEIWIPIQA